ncbi:MAG TPA: hypothetical protein VGH51_07495 [Candidatus Angelobacter sp.]|jgi:hypothetical protein
MLFSNVGKHVALAALPQTQQQSGSGDAKTGDQSQQQGKTTAADSPELSRCGGVEVKQSLGTVSVGCPKVWRSDRVFSVLDGIMRDVDSMTIRALEGLDANAANQAAIDLIQNSFDLTAKYDQAAAINNQFALQKLKTARTNEVSAYNADADFRQKLIKQRNDLTLQLFDAQATERQQTQAGTDTTATQKVETSLQNQITSINNTLNTTPPSISDASLASTASTAISPSDQPQHATLDKMPQGFQDALTNLLKQPTFPPAIAMDNVIDLLHQRIAREFAVIYDDLMRDSEHFDVYLVQFDTSINPKSEARDRGVHVEMAFENCKDGNDPVPLAYELYPSAAAYNIMHGFNQTTHTGITGIAQTVVGFGLQASFQHDHSSLRSGLSQSIYASGFGAGQCKFGWDFAPAPNENRLAPGLRTTYAILRVPKGPGRSGPLQATLRVDWTKRDRRYPGWNPLNWHRSDESKEKSDPKISVLLPQDHVLRVTHVSYVPADTGEKGTGEESNGAKPAAPASAANPAATAGAAPANAAAPAAVSAVAMATPTPRPAVVQIVFSHPIDPNLIVTANDQILKRVRDVRGRGLYSDSTTATALHLAGNSTEIEDLSGSRFGLLESDKLAEDTWLQADSHTILLYIGKKTAGTDHFPVIRIVDPSSGGNGSELTSLAREADTVRIGEWFFTQPDTLSSSSFQPLFTKPYDPGPFSVFIQKVSKPRDVLTTLELRLVSYATTRGTHRPIYLHDQAQVVLEADANDTLQRYILPEGFDLANAKDQPRVKKEQAIPLRPNWAMECRQDRGALVCDVPLRSLRLFCHASTTPQNARKLSGDETIADAAMPLTCLSNFKIWVEEAPYYGRPGMWGDADLSLQAAPAPAQAPAAGTQPYSFNHAAAVPYCQRRDAGDYTNVSFQQAQEGQPRSSQSQPGKNSSGGKDSDERSLEELTKDDEDLIVRGGYDITVRKRGDVYEWLVELEIIDASQKEYDIPEFDGIENTVATHYYMRGHASAPGSKTEPILATEVKANKDQKSQEVVQKYFTPGVDQCTSSGDPQLPFKVCTSANRRHIQFAIPFALYSFIPEKLHIQRQDDRDSRFELPNLRSQLEPHNVKLIPLDKNVYQFQGDQLKAVASVQITPQTGTPAKLAPLARSANAVDVVVPEKTCNKDALCGVQLGIGGGDFPDTFIDLAKTDENGNEVPQTLPDTSPVKPKSTASTEAPKPGAAQTPGFTATATATVASTPSATASATTSAAGPKPGAPVAPVKTPPPHQPPTATPTKTPAPSPAATKTPSPAPAATKTPTPGKKKEER